MKCPKCWGNNDVVTTSRSAGVNGPWDYTRRRRECLTCGYRWTTRESWDGKEDQWDRRKHLKEK